MAGQDDEEKLLRSVALQNASSILIARQRAEQELANSVAMMRATLEATTDAILVTNAEGFITDFNENFVRMWRLSREVMASKQHRLVREAIRQYFDEPLKHDTRMEEIYATSPPQTFDLLECTDGRVIERYSKVQTVEGRNVGRVWTFHDITEQRRSEQRLTFALAAAKLGSWQFDLATRILTPSAQCKANHGFPPDADLQLDAHIVPSIDPEHREPFAAAINAAIETGGSFEIEVPNTWPDGTSHWLMVCGLVMDRATMVGVTLDVTERRRMEQTLIEADRKKDEFLAVMAHELRSPLAAVLMAVRILQTKGPAEPLLQRLRDTIARQTLLLSKLVDDLLDVGRITTGKLRLEKKPVELNSILKEAAEVAAPLVERRNHTLNVQLFDAPLWLDADSGRIAQIVTNLLNNAAKYMNDGGKIDLISSEESGTAVIRVRDSGVGIPEEMLRHIFQRFVQIGGSNYSAGGLGIGLSVVKALVELHGGTVEAESEGVGKGSTFTVRLPLMPHTNE